MIPPSRQLAQTARNATLAGLLTWQAALTTQDILEHDKHYAPVSNIVTEATNLQFAIENCQPNIYSYNDKQEVTPAFQAGLIIGGSVSGFASIPVGAALCGKEYFNNQR